VQLLDLILEIIGWATIGVIGGVMLSQAVGWSGTRVVATLQALTPLLALALVPIAAIALWQGLSLMAAAAGAVGLGALILMASLIFRQSQSRPAGDSAGLRIALANLLYGNERIDEVATDLAEHDLDVIVFSEYTAEHQARLLASQLADGYPFKIDHSAPLAGGIAIWSRQAFTVNIPPNTFDPSLDITLAASPDVNLDAASEATADRIRVIAVHPPTPVYDFGEWTEDLATIARIDIADDTPTLLIGDFNATYWHPGFRNLFRIGYVDAHLAAGHVFSASWPIGKLIPPFVRLDHALTAYGLVSTDVDDFDIPGSDHRGFVVTVASAH